MAETKYNDDEREILLRLPHKARIIYLMELRVFMNYETGIVGRYPREISLQGLRELLEVSAKHTPNNQIECVTRKQVRTALEQLKRVGLIVRIKGARRGQVNTLVFHLPLASTDKSAKNSEGTVRAQSGHVGKVTPISSRGNGLPEGEGTVRARSGHVGEGIHPVSVNREKETTVDSFVDNSVPDAVTLLPDDFKPSDETYSRCYKFDCPPVDKAQIELFKIHHKTKKTFGNKSDWQELFYKWMIIAKQYSITKARKEIKKKGDPKLPSTQSGLLALAKKHGVSTECKTWPELKEALAAKIAEGDRDG